MIQRKSEKQTLNKRQIIYKDKKIALNFLKEKKNNKTAEALRKYNLIIKVQKEKTNSEPTTFYPMKMSFKNKDKHIFR